MWIFMSRKAKARRERAGWNLKPLVGREGLEPSGAFAQRFAEGPQRPLAKPPRLPFPPSALNMS